MGKVFQALSSDIRRKILAYLSASSMTAGEIAERFDISKPSLSKHLGILENAGLVSSEKKGQFVHYSLVEDNLLNTLNSFIHEVCPCGKIYVEESREKARAQTPGREVSQTEKPQRD
ncbi:metalloregulator ArsR/SmtB family transcription factor [Kiloniella laminariae]|uniref:metalloregulator ArsR/SmtB family transcription factor n=1 Tax=Kiloniella laminariae TaxID=454162 RepID=UPI00035D6101|nr:metalloregulator ArsR/SmtB family transcription factor [Kiloniella laminariae]